MQDFQLQADVVIARESAYAAYREVTEVEEEALKLTEHEHRHNVEQHSSLRRRLIPPPLTCGLLSHPNPIRAHRARRQLVSAQISLSRLEKEATDRIRARARRTEDDSIIAGFLPLDPS